MAYYKDAQTWLNEEIRKPMKLILKYGSERDAMELLDFLCDMYIEVQERADMYEEKLGGGHCGEGSEAPAPTHHDYDALPSPYTPEEEMKHREMLIYSLRNPDEWVDGADDGSRFCPVFISSSDLDSARIGSILTGLKKAKGGKGRSITNRDLAKRVGVSEQTISAILSGKTLTSVDVFAAIVGALGYDLVIRK